MESRAVRDNFERDQPKDHPSQIWFRSFRGKDLNVIFYQIMYNLHNQYKSAERKLHRKTWNICRTTHCDAAVVKI
jgi:hypothetical protein